MSEFVLPGFLRFLIPFAQSSPAGTGARAASTTRALEVFLPREDQPTWARRIAEYCRDRFRATCPTWSATGCFRAAASGTGRRAVNWNYALRYPDTYLIQQITGNCVFASAGDVGVTTILGWLIFAQGQPIMWEGCGSASFYMFRGHAGQGATLASAAEAYERYGYPLRKVYCGGKYDLRDTVRDQQFGIDNWRTQPEDFLAETSRVRLGRIAELDTAADDEAQQLIRDCVYAGGVVQTGSTATAAKDGDPVSSGAGIGPHAQVCIGYDDTQEFRDRYQAATGKRLAETVYIFDQTHGPVQYVRSGWMADLHGRQTQGIFLLPWRSARSLFLSTSYLYWPEGATGTAAGPPAWDVTRATG